MNSLRLSQDDYIESRKVISEQLSKKIINHPFKFAKILGAALVNADSRDGFAETVNDKSTLAMRKAHDFYGWMAKEGKLGACKGSIYRSQNFMNIPARVRSGKRMDAKTAFGVHIEHTIPIKQIILALWAQRDSMLKLENHELITKSIFESFLKLSVCTALTRQEEQQCIRPGYHYSHPDFEDSGKPLPGTSLEDIRPFTRYVYTDDLKIFEVITGQEIALETWSLKDHAELISTVNIYNWDCICQNDVI